MHAPPLAASQRERHRHARHRHARHRHARHRHARPCKQRTSSRASRCSVKATGRAGQEWDRQMLINAQGGKRSNRPVTDGNARFMAKYKRRR
eukprot:6185898-Pleurochrysis_carterae.AAC.2